MELIDTVFGAGKFTGDGGGGGAEYPCVRRLRNRRLITFLWLQGLRAPTKLITRVAFFSVMDLRLLVEWGRWSHAVDHLSRFLPPPPDTGRPLLSLSVEAAVLHRFLVVHMALADIVAGRISYHAATSHREYFSRDRAVCQQGTIRLRSILYPIIDGRASLDWECVRRRAAEIVYDLAYLTPELRQLALMPGGSMDPHDVLPISSGFRRSRHVKKQAGRRRPRAFARALAKLYLEKRSSLPSLSQESPDELLTKTLNWVADILDESLRAGIRQENPLQTIGNEGAHVAAVTQTMNLASHSQNSAEHLDQEGSNAGSGCNPKKNPREELTTSDEQDLHLKRQRTPGDFGKAS